jgi:hypothetical protein
VGVLRGFTARSLAAHARLPPPRLALLLLLQPSSTKFK